MAFLIRRMRELLAAENLRCVGTSATLAGSGTYEEQRAEICRVATRLFGADVRPENVIGETLRRATPERGPRRPRVRRRPDSSRSRRRAQPAHRLRGLRSRSPLRLDREHLRRDERGGHGAPRPRPAREHLRAATEPRRSSPSSPGCRRSGAPRRYRRACSPATSASPTRRSDRPPFAFRLHQFISRGDTVYASLEAEEERYITLTGPAVRPWRPGPRADAARLLPGVRPGILPGPRVPG